MGDADPADRVEGRLPGRLWRVVFLEAVGFPLPTERREKQRTYKSPADVARMLDTIERWPSHHRLIGVWTARTTWERVDPGELPAPLTHETTNPEE